MLVKANTEYFEKGNLVVNSHIKIILHYFKYDFLLDGIALSCLLI
jgi:hypothetical protein